MTAEDILVMLHNAPTPCVATDSNGTQMIKVSGDPHVEQYVHPDGRPDLRDALGLVPPLDFTSPLTPANADALEAYRIQDQRSGESWMH